jgi:TPR repeat protein
MNFPLYDGNVSPNARQFIADGRLSEALAEYQRLASMGSNLAKCILAYLSLRDLPGLPRDMESAKSLANAALSGEPGYANYVLAYAATYEKASAASVRYMSLSYQAGFIPAASALGLIFSQGYGTAKDSLKAEQYFLRAIIMGHVPAPMLLCRFYTLGRRGFLKQIVGIMLFPIAFLYAGIATRFFMFSVHCFRHFRNRTPPMFNEEALKQ